MNFKLKLFSLFVFSLCFTGCGYHLAEDDGLTARYNSISVPYAIGDNDGSLTAAVIKEIARSGTFEYRDCGGSLTLKIKKIDLSQENIGFRYDRKKRGKLTDDIIPTEMRMTLVAEVVVVEAASGKQVLGPIKLSASIDFDHDYYFSRNGINVFSLGQLSDVDAAYVDVQEPLEEILAKKIVDYISQSW